MRTEFLNTAGPGSSSLTGRGIAASRQSDGESGFQHALSAASLEKSPKGATEDVPTPPSGSRDSNTPSIIETTLPSDRSTANQTRGVPSNPFGLDVAQNVGLSKEVEWMDYFKTHAPGEWMSNAAARAQFAQTYSAAALVTLDWTGTVPENIDPTWVTHCEVDATGKPLPHVSSEELT